MAETRRLLDSAVALSALLTVNNIPHAFYGSVLSATLANSMYTNEIYCIVEGGQNKPHPFRRARDAVSGKDDWSSTHSPWTNRLHVTYRAFIPPIEIEILPAGETGPRHLDDTNVMTIQGIPFLNISEFVRAKLKTWMIRGAEGDAHDIIYILTRFWNRVDINRIPEQDMNHFVSRNNTAAAAWSALRRKYGM
ncbi:hypothetical protein AGABI1DRAFT_122646 [Agaricus bisporus var. burnettii JB137-S8]|uniref:Uncharacterized protein n=2 Tax=Agaricus bisporus var. burnettii TaxID=192524 RepID=K5VPU5_AGABU|nr:hypothetical protein AGABI2DRAFT_194464 [Agaricus bisporus var. bisporus H97]XP_007332933.1 uncharacterized protein AGABI1DRAFT_122646 [Agaricus bisporus var. burnettii JB137-S8]EKM76494.1 hypothetical protein AGABI1DRAFT_122646 [Agaricus bisporus var. burnettii JB137-S8]EKV44393.1 hypothetical protein AGABI2DRAFT_194464 [Agaricus bisporus var. bisporus H97]KAF7761410.1 hypothetical protein Agabi119p4_9402 [Agaricus bisporus var. burnettii]